ncbi:MAG TPA: hypothetical protein VFG04_04860 [Planctomycetaceae bacterium]|jgi:hypothetical protein|nr:hypothetical protein [Planctomycetaceae bacterium]
MSRIPASLRGPTPPQKERSWIDPLSNLMFLHQVDIAKSLPEIQQGGALPLDTLQSFLHEVTHQWWFDSPVGVCLALLALRARHRAFLKFGDGANAPHKSDRVDSSDPFIQATFEDVLRLRLATELLRPLAEGAALFSEFDAWPGDSQVIASPMAHMSRLFIPADLLLSTLQAPQTGPVDPLSLLQEKILRGVRLSPPVVERKANLLCSPLEVGEGGYLAGYLAVKKMVGLGRAHSKRAWHDTFFCLTFLRAFFYEDLGLVAAILSPGTPEQIAEGIVGYFDARCAQLGVLSQDENELDGVLARLEAEMVNLSRPPVNQPPTDGSDEVPISFAELDRFTPILTGPEIAQNGRRLLRELTRTVMQRPTHILGPYVQRTAHNLLARRLLISLGSQPVEYALVDGKERRLVAQHEGRQLWSVAFSREMALREPSGALELYYDPTCQALFVALTTESGTLAVEWLTEAPPDRQALMAEVDFSRSLIDAESQLLSVIVDDALEKASLDEVVNNYVAKVNRASNDQYSRWLSTHRPRHESCKLAMEGDGFWSLLGGRRDRIEALATMSLVASATVREVDVANALARRGIDWETTAATFDQIKERSGYRLLIRTQLGVTSNV